MAVNSEKFREIILEYYRKERDRAEQCLADILNSLDNKELSESQHIDWILGRLTQHYSRL